MIAFLRFIGLMNAAVWLGAVVVYAALISPALVSSEMLDVFGGARNPMAPAYRGLAVEIVAGKFYWVHFICSGVAAFHLLVEWLFTGKATRTLMLYLAMTIIVLGLANGLLLHHKMKELHRIRYGRTVPAPQKDKAANMFQTLQTATDVMHWIMVAGLVVYLWKTATPGEQPRFNSTRKFKS
ncbi:MAG: hypothetical protein ACO1QS_01500 [Verrucomicrobiota bacterium]